MDYLEKEGNRLDRYSGSRINQMSREDAIFYLIQEMEAADTLRAQRDYMKSLLGDQLDPEKVWKEDISELEWRIHFEINPDFKKELQDRLSKEVARRLTP